MSRYSIQGVLYVDSGCMRVTTRQELYGKVILQRCESPFTLYGVLDHAW